MKAFTFLARRFVAGETPESAVRAGLRLHERGIKATFDRLGEDVDDREKARRVAEANAFLLRAIPERMERNVSIKLTSLGLDVAEDFCVEMVNGILDVAREVGGFVRIDMEGSRHTQRTIDVFRKVREDHDNVGIVLQAALHRTEQDVREAVERGDRVRLCKGAYHEPPEIAWTKMDDIRESFRRCARLLLAGRGHTAIATHDESLVRDTIEWTRANGIAPSRFEFQMLYGLRPRRWDQLVREGFSVRIYVPYGTHWFPYFYRRLREKKANVLFVLRGLLGN
jgi:proline dehydrogenase